MFEGGEVSAVPRARFGHFLRSLLKEPLAVGAVAPSSRRLAHLMVAGMGPGSRVVELGAGTGAVTRAILDAGVSCGDLTVVEQNAELAQLLRERFPEVSVIQADAVSFQHHAGGRDGTADFVISGLPLTLFSVRRKTRLLLQAFRVLHPDGVFHQFTYAGRCPVERPVLRSLGLEASFLKFTPFNLPPAFVYRLRRC